MSFPAISSVGHSIVTAINQAWDSIVQWFSGSGEIAKSIRDLPGGKNALSQIPGSQPGMEALDRLLARQKEADLHIGSNNQPVVLRLDMLDIHSFKLLNDVPPLPHQDSEGDEDELMEGGEEELLFTTREFTENDALDDLDELSAEDEVETAPLAVSEQNLTTIVPTVRQGGSEKVSQQEQRDFFNNTK